MPDLVLKLVATMAEADRRALARLLAPYVLEWLREAGDVPRPESNWPAVIRIR